MIDIHDLIRQASALSTEDVDVPQPIPVEISDGDAGESAEEHVSDDQQMVPLEPVEPQNISPETTESEPFRVAHVRRPESIEAEFEHPASGRETQGQQPIEEHVAHDFQPRNISPQTTENAHDLIIQAESMSTEDVDVQPIQVESHDSGEFAELSATVEHPASDRETKIGIHDLIRNLSALSTDVDVPQPIQAESGEADAGFVHETQVVEDYGVQQVRRQPMEPQHISPETDETEPFRFAHLRLPESIEAEFAEFRGTVEHPARGRETQGQQPTGIAHELALELQPALERMYDRVSEEIQATIEFEQLMEDRRRTI